MKRIILIAAINIENEGRRLYKEQIGIRNPELTLVDYQEKSNLFEDRLKQENGIYEIYSFS